MNAATGEWFLKKLILRYSETGGSSLGVRFYLRHLVQNWKERNPQVQLTTVHSQFEHPELTAIWASGESHVASLRNLSPKQIEDFLTFYRNSEGPNSDRTSRSPQSAWERGSAESH